MRHAVRRPRPGSDRRGGECAARVERGGAGSRAERRLELVQPEARGPGVVQELC